jgi:hypothetical protein
MADKGSDVTVNEARREIVFSGDVRRIFHDVTSFNASGSWLRLETREGYIVANPANILYMVVPSSARVA